MPMLNATAPAAKKVPNTSTARVAKETELTAKRSEAITSLGQFAQIPLMATKQFADVGTIAMHWPNVSKELAKLAETTPVIARIVDPLMQVGPYAGLIAAVMPMVMQFGVNHNRMVPGAMGTMPATAISAQVEAQAAQQELEALSIQLQAEKAAAAVRQEIAEARRAMADAMRDHQKDSTGD